MHLPLAPRTNILHSCIVRQRVVSETNGREFMTEEDGMKKR